MRRRKINRAHAGGGAIGKEFLAAAVLGALLVLLTPLLVRAEKVEQLEARGYVSDFAGVLDARMAGALTNLCAEVDQKAHAQIAVVTVRSLEDVPEQDFANRLYERWGIGYKGEDRGALILLSVDDRRYGSKSATAWSPSCRTARWAALGARCCRCCGRGTTAGRCSK